MTWSVSIRRFRLAAVRPALAMALEWSNIFRLIANCHMLTRLIPCWPKSGHSLSAWQLSVICQRDWSCSDQGLASVCQPGSGLPPTEQCLVNWSWIDNDLVSVHQAVHSMISMIRLTLVDHEMISPLSGWWCLVSYWSCVISLRSMIILWLFCWRTPFPSLRPRDRQDPIPALLVVFHSSDAIATSS